MERSLVAPPSFVIPGRNPSVEAIDAITLLTGASDAADLLVQSSLDLYVRQMLSTSTLRLEVPVPLLPGALLLKRIKTLLPPSAARRIKFVDRTCGKWDAVQRYLKPVLDDARGASRPSEGERKPESIVRELMGHVYSISLSVSRKAPAIVPPVPMLELIERLEEISLTSESRARLAVLRGVAACFERHSEIPALVCKPQLGVPLSERIEEILEDAYLLEASRLRTFFSPGANWAALRRDLRKTLGWVVRNRGWAKQAVRLGEQVVTVPGQTSVVTDALAEFGLAAGQESCPVLLDETHNAWKGGNTVIQVKYPGAVALFLP
jgi:hypothetical protein